MADNQTWEHPAPGTRGDIVGLARVLENAKYICLGVAKQSPLTLRTAADLCEILERLPKKEG
jgi:hypothetical protein